MATITIGRTLTAATDSVTAIQGSPPWDARVVNKLVPEYYDEIGLGYTLGNMTSVIYKLLGVTVATLSLEYDGSGNLTKVARV